MPSVATFAKIKAPDTSALPLKLTDQVPSPVADIVLEVAKLATLTTPLPSIDNPVPIFIPPKPEAVAIGKVRKFDLFNHAVPFQYISSPAA